MKLPSILLLAACTVLGTGASFVSSADANPRSSSTTTVTTSRGQLGAQVITISDSLRRHFAAPADAGLLVDRVVPKSPADKAGLATGDVIVAVHGSPVSETWDIFKALSNSKAGDKVNLKIIRDKKPRTLQVTLDADAPGGSMANLFDGKIDPFDNDHWGPTPMFRHGKSFPFAPSPKAADGDLQDKIRQLEERLQRLESKNTAVPRMKVPAKKPLK
tara:strand:- start:28213 stop:28863 length:651 start_codon:yes stop_codon:yes gene_type:complete